MVENDATSEDCGEYEIINFEGGLYAVHTAIDSDGKRYRMGHMINPTEEIKKGLGYHQYELFVPIKLKEEKENGCIF
ncbi:MAG: hypothetical protein LBI03_02570 [Clostridiales bacterium]|jgi:hypothetical protein|nr:hypothetical protein [Clostridiales bacterium]